VVHAGEHGRLEPVAGPGDALAAQQQLRTLGDGVRDLALEHCQLRRTRERPEVGRLVHRIAAPVALHGGDESIHETVVDALVHVDAFHRAAALPRVVHRAIGEGFRGGLDVGVLADVDRVLAAQFELQLHHARRTGRGNPRARRVGAGEEYAVHRLRGERRARGACAAHHREDVRGDARGPHHLANREARERGIFRGLVKHGVPSEERRHENVRADEVGVIPGRDVRHHAERLVRDALLQLRLFEHCLRRERARRVLEEEIEPAGERLELAVRLADGFAHLAREGAREIGLAPRGLVPEAADGGEASVE
jgi:hypothetical protein